jgi:hypothetical protein
MKGRDLLRSAFRDTTTLRADCCVLGANAETDADKRVTRAAVVFNMMVVFEITVRIDRGHLEERATNITTVQTTS